ncbi:MAG: hypothetical protein JXA25_02715 [Anaerolineales bacterium]|nr:hypothetical protein [Anaerolineales bacterium]
MGSTAKAQSCSIKQLTDLEMVLMLASVFLITGSPLDKLSRPVWLVTRLIGYSVPLLILLRHLLPVYRFLPSFIKDTWRQYRPTILLPLGLLFLGECIGAMRGPTPLYSLWQTTSLLFVLVVSVFFFGIAVPDPQIQVRRLLRILSKLTMAILILSLPIYLGNVRHWWVINPYIMYTGQMLLNGPFYHANVFGYVLMLAALASLFLALDGKKNWDFNRGWMAATGFLLLGLLLTFARGAIVGTGLGILGLLYFHNRKLAVILTIPVLLAGIGLVLFATGILQAPAFLPKLTLSGRETVWAAAVNNLKLYGPFGVGAGNAESLPGLSTHNIFMEQYGEGGILTLFGFLAWVLLPILHMNHSRLDRPLACAVIMMMVAELAHGLFWTEFMNGLRYQTLVYAFLWAALAAPKTTAEEQTELHAAPSPQ